MRKTTSWGFSQITALRRGTPGRNSAVPEDPRYDTALEVWKEAERSSKNWRVKKFRGASAPEE